jgi:hypothetical protein
VTALIAKLPLGSLLTLRVTCKTTRKWVDLDHQSILAERLKDIQVAPRTWSRCGRTFEELPAALPFSNFDLHLPAPEMYETPGVIGFRRRFGQHIRQLEVYSFWKCKLEGEWDFFESLVNLEQLTIHKITTRPYDSSTPSRIPHSSIQNLKSLSIRQSEGLEDPKSVVPYSLQMFENALKLETFAPAYVTRIVEDGSFSQGFRNNLQWFLHSWDRRTSKLSATNGKETLANIKLWECLQRDYRKNDTITENFPDWIEFVRRLLQSSPEINLGNVTPAMLVSLKDEPDELQRRFADRIVSIQSLKWSIRTFELPNLEELFGFDSVLEPIIDDGSVHPQWPKLNKLRTDKFTNRVS